MISPLQNKLCGLLAPIVLLCLPPSAVKADGPAEENPRLLPAAQPAGAWNYCVRKGRERLATANAVYGWAVDASGKIAASATSWLDNFAGRMGEEAEKSIWASSPWNTSPLLTGAEAGIITAWYTLGYCSGYIAEQVVIGAITGGVTKLAVVLAKAAGQATFHLAKRAVAQIWTRIHALKTSFSMEVVDAGSGLPINAILNEAASTSGKKAIGAHANLRETAMEAIETMMRKQGFDRSKFNFKVVVDRMMWSERYKALLANPGTRDMLFNRFATLGKLLGDDVEGKFMKNFLDFAEDRLIVVDGQGNFQKEWMEDWMRAFKGNSSELVNRPPLESITDGQRVFLKHVLTDENPLAGILGKPGDFWRLDDPPWNLIDPTSPHWERYRIRGIIAELDLYHQKYRADGFIHTPTAQAIDYTKDITVQAKSVKNPDGAVSKMREAMDDLIDETPPGINMKLHVSAKPGSDYTSLEQALIDYRRDLVDLEFLDDISRIEIKVQHYSVTE